MASTGDIQQRVSRLERDVDEIWQYARTVSDIVTGHTTQLKNIERTLRAHSAQFVVISERFDRIDARLDQMDKRFDRMDQRFDQIDARLDRMDKRFDRMDQRFDQLFTFFGIPPGGVSQN